MSDHKDSEHFMYNRTWEEIELMLDKAERNMNLHYNHFLAATDRHKKIVHARNYKALQGVVKTLRWVLGDKNIIHPLK